MPRGWRRRRALRGADGRNRAGGRRRCRPPRRGNLRGRRRICRGRGEPGDTVWVLAIQCRVRSDRQHTSRSSTAASRRTSAEASWWALVLRASRSRLTAAMAHTKRIVAKNGRAEKARFFLAGLDVEKCGRRNGIELGSAMETGSGGGDGHVKTQNKSRKRVFESLCHGSASSGRSPRAADSNDEAPAETLSMRASVGRVGDFRHIHCTCTATTGPALLGTLSIVPIVVWARKQHRAPSSQRLRQRRAYMVAPL